MRLLLLAAWSLFIPPCMAQSGKIDSLLQCLRTAKEDTEKVYLLTNISHAYTFIRPDSSYYFAKVGEDLSGRLNFPPGQAYNLANESGLMTFKGNYPQGIALALTALQFADESGDPSAEADAMDALGTAYYFQHDYRQALTYYEKCIPLQMDTRFLWMHERALTNTGDVYQAMGMTDSALYFSSRALAFADSVQSFWARSDELNNMAAIYSTMGRDSLAHLYFSLGMEASRGTNEFDNFCTGALGDAHLFLKEGRRDSALIFAYVTLNAAHAYNLRARELEADKLISALYESVGKTDSSYKYLKRTVTLQDTLFSEERLKAIENMTLEETSRQQEIAAQKKKEAETKWKNLQLIAIALFIPIFFLLVVFLYRIKVRPRIIEFLAIMNLLLVFEFITDLTFPLISDWSKESPLWEMLILVLIASILEPLNFKVESWLKRRLGTLGQPQPAS